MILARRVFLQLLAAKPKPTILIVASDAGWLECAGGAVAARASSSASSSRIGIPRTSAPNRMSRARLRDLERALTRARGSRPCGCRS